MSSSSDPSDSTRIAELDVLRGVAITLVIAYHLPGQLVRGGLIGVDLFMVLSGYLVTKRLSAENLGREILQDFYRRRIRRIIPPVAVVISACAVIALLEPVLFRGSRLEDLAASMGFFANWHFILSGADYFNTVAGTSPVQHLWSLAIEEQFYVVWPLIVLVSPKRFRLMVAATISASSMIWMAINASSWTPSRLYFGTDTRIFALTVGSCLALTTVSTSRASQSLSRMVWPLLLVTYAILAVVIEPSHTLMYHFGYQLLAIVALAMVWTSITRAKMVKGSDSAWTRIFSALGARSYSLYLVHWPVFIELDEFRTKLNGPWLACFQLVVTAILSECLYRGVEKRFSRSLPVLGLSFRAVLPGSLLLISVLVVLAGRSPDLPAYLSGKDKNEVISAQTSGLPRVLIVGDSVVASLEPALRAASSAHNIALDVVSISGCGLIQGMTVGEDGSVYEPSRQCENRVNEEFWRILPNAKYEAVVWLSAWDAEDRLIDGRVLRQVDNQRELAKHVTQVFNRLQTSAHEIYVAPVPVRAMTSAANPEGPSDYAEKRILAAAENIRDIADGFSPRIRVIDIPRFVCGTSRSCPDSADDGTRYRPTDGIHFEGRGAVLVADFILGRIADELVG